jgi:hypothetical protein
MLDLPGAPYLDKDTLIGGCVRLPLRVDSQRLFDEIQRIPQSAWGTRGGRIGVHRVAEAIFLRGFAPAEGDLPIEDRPILSDLPYVQVIVRQLIAAPPLRCLLARLPAGGIIRIVPLTLARLCACTCPWKRMSWSPCFAGGCVISWNVARSGS